MGTLPLERAYYHCRSCGTGTVPWDEALGLSRLRALFAGGEDRWDAYWHPELD